MKDQSTLKKLYDEIADTYLLTRTIDKGIVGVSNREIEQPIMYDLVPKNLKNKRLLDLGCGPGVHMNMYVSRGARCIGVDISDNMIRLAKKQCPKAEFIVSDMAKINFKKDSFDVITSSYSMDYVKDLEKFAKDVHKILKKDGLFICSLPHPFYQVFANRRQGDFTMTRTYFDKSMISHHIGGLNKDFYSYPHQLQEYFVPFLKNGFMLERFIENEPIAKWKKTYGKESKFLFMMPVICFFVWRKK